MVTVRDSQQGAELKGMTGNTASVLNVCSNMAVLARSERDTAIVKLVLDAVEDELIRQNRPLDLASINRVEDEIVEGLLRLAPDMGAERVAGPNVSQMTQRKSDFLRTVVKDDQ